MTTAKPWGGSVPAQRPASESLWARSDTKSAPRATSRQRHVVEGLPSWDPLPPGEILVRRPRG